MAPELLCTRPMQSNRSCAAPDELSVTIVSRNPETLDALQQYLRGAGVGARGTNQPDPSAHLTEKCSAVVFFPDDFRHDEVESALVELRRARPRIRTILVTSEPARFGRMKGSIVIPKPVWGWTLLDTLRSEGGMP